MTYVPDGYFNLKILQRFDASNQLSCCKGLAKNSPHLNQNSTARAAENVMLKGVYLSNIDII